MQAVNNNNVFSWYNDNFKTLVLGFSSHWRVMGGFFK